MRSLAEGRDSKVGARRHVGTLLDLNPATLRNWVENAERAEGSRALTIAPSTYQPAQGVAGVRGSAATEAFPANALVTLHPRNWGVLGVLGRRAGPDVGRDQAGRLTRLAGITAVVRGRHITGTTVREVAAPRHPDLVKRGWAAPSAPVQPWVADFSHGWTVTGFVDVATLVNVFSRRIPGWRVATTQPTPVVTFALHQALTARHVRESGWEATGLIHHSDVGSQRLAGIVSGGPAVGVGSRLQPRASSWRLWSATRSPSRLRRA